MKPYWAGMYPDEITLSRYTEVISDAGVPKRTYVPEQPIPASVEAGQDTRTEPDGRVITRMVWNVDTPDDLRATPDDRIAYHDGTRERTLVVEAGTVPGGIGNVAWFTQCAEVT